LSSPASFGSLLHPIDKISTKNTHVLIENFIVLQSNAPSYEHRSISVIFFNPQLLHLHPIKKGVFSLTVCSIGTLFGLSESGILQFI
jgi:hypothetical protein